MIFACRNNSNPNRVYFSINPNDRKIIIPVQLNDSITANMLFDTGSIEGVFDLDSLFIAENPCLTPDIRPDTSRSGSSWGYERYLNLVYENTFQKVKIGNTNLTFNHIEVMNWKKAMRNAGADGLFNIPKNDTTHVWELNLKQPVCRLVMK